METLPPDRTPLYHHPLPLLEAWLRQLGARQRAPHSPIWDLHRPQWSARIELSIEELQVSWYQEGSERAKHLPYAISRAIAEEIILAGP